MEMIHHILSYTSIWDAFRTRQSCKALLQQVTIEFIKKKWKQAKKILETKLLQNRCDIILALRMARVVIDVNKRSIKMIGDKERLLLTLRENEKLEEEAWRMKAKYKESNLTKFGMKRIVLKDVRSIRGDNLWTIDVEGYEEGILVIPKTIGMDEFCMQHGKVSAFMIVELVLHEWAKGLEHTVIENEDRDETDSLRSMKLVPIFGRRFQLDDLLYAMGMHPAGILSSSDEWIDQTWIPNSICQTDGTMLYGDRN